MVNVDLQQINNRINDFVSQPENARLKAGTGSFSTPFRGTLFGHKGIAEVNACLQKQRSIDVLWLGSNPNCPESVANILENTGGPGCFPDFQQQLRSGHLSEQGWDPINNPQRGWRTYAMVLDGTSNLSRVIMANSIPWGSSRTEEFLGPLANQDRELVSRLLEFSDELVAEIVSMLRPRLLIVPKSLAENKTIRELLPTYSLLKSNVRESVDLPVPAGNKRFHCYSGHYECEPLALKVPALFVPHPSGIQLTVDSRRQFVEALQKVVTSLMS